MYSAALALSGQDEIANKRFECFVRGDSLSQARSFRCRSARTLGQECQMALEGFVRGAPAPQPPLTVTGPF